MKDINVWQSKFQSCVYSDKLINKIILLNKKCGNNIDINEIKKAIYYAKKYHAEQTRQSGEPYYTHPLAVAEMVIEHIPKTDPLVISILHDILEDTRMTKENLKILFGDNIAESVDSLTRLKLGKKITVDQMVDSLWIHRVNDDLLLIKYFDRIHNLQTLGCKSKPDIEKTIITTLKKFLSLSLYLKSKNLINSRIHENMLKLCYKHLKLRHTASTYQPLVNDFRLSPLIYRNAKLHTKNQ